MTKQYQVGVAFGLSVLTIILVVVYTAAGYIYVRTSYGFKIGYESAPSDDHELVAWLESHPGVSHVDVYRKDRDLYVFYLISQNLLGQPPLPDVMLFCTTNKYNGAIMVDPHYRDTP